MKFKYRIVLIETTADRWYEVERKILFWWLPIYSERFLTYDTAKKFVDSLAGERRRVIQVIETI